MSTSFLRQNFFNMLLDDCYYRAEPPGRAVHQESPHFILVPFYTFSKHLTIILETFYFHPDFFFETEN